MAYDESDGGNAIYIFSISKLILRRISYKKTDGELSIFVIDIFSMFQYVVVGLNSNQ